MRRIILFALKVIICSCGRNTGAKQNGADTKIKELRIVSRTDSVITNVSEIASDIEYISLQLSVNTPKMKSLRIEYMKLFVYRYPNIKAYKIGY